jgi:hypothetical protein
MVCNFHEDIAAMIQVCNTGRNPTMRHLGRTHRVDVHWLHEVFGQPYMNLLKEESLRMRADIFTKAFDNPEKWGHALEMIAHVDPKSWWRYDPSATRIKVLDTPALQGTGGDTSAAEANGTAAAAAPTAPTELPITIPRNARRRLHRLFTLLEKPGGGRLTMLHILQLE